MGTQLRKLIVFLLEYLNIGFLFQVCLINITNSLENITKMVICIVFQEYMIRIFLPFSYHQPQWYDSVMFNTRRLTEFPIYRYFSSMHVLGQVVRTRSTYWTIIHVTGNKFSIILPSCWGTGISVPLFTCIQRMHKWLHSNSKKSPSFAQRAL